MTDRLGRADLHVHTLASDGIDPIATILDHVERSTDLDVVGNGFASLLWTTTTQANGAAANAANAHVYLVDGTYDPGEGGDSVKDTAQIDECTGVLVVSDTEVVCQLDLRNSINAAGTTVSATKVPVGTYSITVVSNGMILPNALSGEPDFTQTVISSGSTFTVADY